VTGLLPAQVFSTMPALVRLFETASEARVPLSLDRLAEGRAETLADGRRIVVLEDVSATRGLESQREALSLRIAHDLRNPVASLIGYVDLVDTSGDLSDDQHYFVDRARSTAMKFYAVIGDLVDLAWIEANMPLPRAKIDLRAAILSVVETLTPKAGDKQISITTAFDGDLPPILAYPDGVRTVISKLLENAIVYSATGQPVSVRAWAANGSVYCSVSDQGIGIAENEVDYVFDRLYRSDDPRVSAIDGGGLGLTTARSIVQRVGGEIRVESALDQGSTFTFRLPAAKGESL
jgi:signal transduction histidine kinase